MAGEALVFFATLKEAPKSYGDERVRIAAAVAVDMQGAEIDVRFLPRSSGDFEPWGEGDKVLCVAAYGSLLCTYALSSFSGNPEVQAGANRELHARGSGSLRFVGAKGDAEITLDGGGDIEVSTVNGTVRVGADAVELDADNGDVDVSATGDVNVSKTGALPPEAVALQGRLSAEILAIYAGIKAAFAVVPNGAAANTALDNAITAALVITRPGELTTILGGQGAINLNAEPDPL